MDLTTEYQFSYTDLHGKEFEGKMLHSCDKEALDYYRSLQDHGKLKITSVKNLMSSRQIWRNYGN